MNNLKIPLGVACSLLVFGERVDALRLGLGGLLILGALWINRRDESKIE
jgi:drug/metabolite transporter (DMT)-like permease